MNCYIENHISRKLKLVDTLYYSPTILSAEALAASIGVSVLTLRKYLKDYRLNTRTRAFNQTQREHSYEDIISESLFYKILFLIFTKPGLSATDYSNLLSISNVNFYKQVKKLNEALSSYGIRTTVDEGYHLIAENESLLRSVLFCFIIAYNTSNSTIYHMTQPLITILEKNGISCSIFGFDKAWESRYLSVIFLINLLRHAQERAPNQSLKPFKVNGTLDLQFEDMNTILDIVPSVSFEDVVVSLELMKTYDSKMTIPNRTSARDCIDGYVKSLNMEHFDGMIRSEQCVKDLIERGIMLSHWYPFDINETMVVVKDFYHDYVSMNQEIVDNFETLLEVCTQYCKCPFKQYREILFYWFMKEGGETLVIPRKKVLIVENSQDTRAMFSVQELKQLLNIIKINGTFSVITEQEFQEELHCNQFDLIISDTHLSDHKKVIQKVSNNGSLIVESVLDYFKN